LINTHRFISLRVTALAMGLQTFAYSQTASENAIRMNQIQVIGSHNSYHAGIAPSESRIFQEKNLKLYQPLLQPVCRLIQSLIRREP
jgi:hypothetical protein